MIFRFLISSFLVIGIQCHVEAQSIRIIDIRGDTTDCASFPAGLYSSIDTPHFFDETVQYTAVELRPLAFCDVDSVSSSAASIAIIGNAFPCRLEHSSYLGAGIEKALLLHVGSGINGIAFSNFDQFASDNELSKYNLLGVDSACIARVGDTIASVILEKKPYLSQSISSFTQSISLSSIDTTIEVVRDRLALSVYLPSNSSISLGFTNSFGSSRLTTGRFLLRGHRIDAKFHTVGDSKYLKLSSGLVGDTYNLNLYDLTSDSIRLVYDLFPTPKDFGSCEFSTSLSTILTAPGGAIIDPTSVNQDSKFFSINSSNNIFRVSTLDKVFPDSILGTYTAYESDDYFFLYSNPSSCSQITDYLGDSVSSTSAEREISKSRVCIDLQISNELGQIMVTNPIGGNGGVLHLFDFSGREFQFQAQDGYVIIPDSGSLVFAGGFFIPDFSSISRASVPVCISYSE